MRREFAELHDLGALVPAQERERLHGVLRQRLAPVVGDVLGLRRQLDEDERHLRGELGEELLRVVKPAGVDDVVHQAQGERDVVFALGYGADELKRDFLGAEGDGKAVVSADLPRQGDFPDGIWRRYSYENVTELEAKAARFPILAGKYGPAARASYLIGGWRVLCIGPDNAWNPMVQYDPTNGVMSAGNIMRTQNDPQGFGSEQR